MKSLKVTFLLSMFVILSFSTFAQSLKIGPRITGNFNIYNQKGLTGTWNGLGIGVGGSLDITFGKTIGILTNVVLFDMKNFSNTTTQNNVTVENSLTLSYLSISPMFKAEFSGFYLVGGPSIGIKLNSSGETTQTATGQQPVVQAQDFETKSIVFNIATGAGYNFVLSPGLYLASDFMVYIPITDTYNFPGIGNSIFALKLGATLKFQI